MPARRGNRRAAILTLLAFSVATVVSVWKLIENGPSPLTLIPAVCFPIATAASLYLALRDDAERTPHRRQR